MLKFLTHLIKKLNSNQKFLNLFKFNINTNLTHPAMFDNPTPNIPKIHNLN